MLSPRSSDGAEEVEVTPELLWALADECTRWVLRYFHESDETEVAIDALTERVAEQLGDPYLSDPNKVSIRLYHHSLPQLAALELIEYDPDREVVRRQTDRVLSPELLAQLWELDE